MMKTLPLLSSLILSIVCVESAFAQTEPASPIKEQPTASELTLNAPQAQHPAINDVKTMIDSGATSRALPTFPLSDTGPNRIAIDGQKIVQAIFDQTQLEVQTDEANGQIFVIARSKTPQAIFLTTDQEQTHALTLLPQKIASQNIVIKGKSLKGEKETFVSQKTHAVAPRLSSLPIETADTFPLALKNLMIAMARKELPEGFTVTNRCGENCLRHYQSDTYDAKVLRFQNHELRSITLSEKRFFDQGVLAIAIEKPVLRVGERSLIYVISRASAAPT